MTGTVVIGLGNPILGDDAVGLHVARALQGVLAGVRGLVFKELHAGGMRIMDAVAGFERAVIVDAMCSGSLAPGSVRRLEAAQLGRARNLASTHDTNLPTALELGRVLGLRMPSEVTVFGIEAREVETFGEALSEEVLRSVPEAVRLISRELRP
jgi:hydrogenase maturation protease